MIVKEITAVKTMTMMVKMEMTGDDDDQRWARISKNWNLSIYLSILST